MKIDGFLHCDFYAPTAQISDAARVKLILYRLFVARGYASVHIRFPGKGPYEDLCRRICS